MDGFKLNHEGIDGLKRNVGVISHVHISELGLKHMEKRKSHQELKEIYWHAVEGRLL